MIKKLLTILLAFTILITSAGVDSISANEANIGTRNIVKVIDEQAVKELLIESTEENSSYEIVVTQDTYGVYNWTSKIKQDGITLSENKLKVNGFSEQFSMSELGNKILAASVDNADLQQYYANNVEFVDESQPSPKVVPLVLLAVGGLSASTVAALEAAAFATLTTTVAVAVGQVLNEKKATSTLSYPAESVPTTVPKWSEFTSVPNQLTTSAVKHMEAALVTTVASRIRNSSDVEVYVSSANGSNLKKSVMVVYNVTSSLTGRVNRHLGNTLNGSKVDTSIADETLDLNGYTVFMIYNHITGKVFHAHFVPTALRARELDYNRFLGQFDLRIYPTVIQDTSYLTFANRSDLEQLRYEQWYGSSLNSRKGSLLSDSLGRKSVVPRK